MCSRIISIILPPINRNLYHPNFISFTFQISLETGGRFSSLSLSFQLAIFLAAALIYLHLLILARRPLEFTTTRSSRRLIITLGNPNPFQIDPPRCSKYHTFFFSFASRRERKRNSPILPRE